MCVTAVPESVDHRQRVAERCQSSHMCRANTVQCEILQISEKISVNVITLVTSL